MSQHSSAFLQVVDEAKKHIREITMDEVKKMQEANEDFHFVDVREDREWSSDHLPNAVHLSKGIIERDIETAIPNKRAKIILYCGGGYRSALAAESLQKMGYDNVLSMVEGYRGWKEANYPLVND